MESIVQIIADNAVFTFKYGNFVLGGTLILFLLMDCKIAGILPRTSWIKALRWFLFLLVCINGAFIYSINIPLKPMVMSSAALENSIGKELEDVSFYDVQTEDVRQLSEINSELVIVNIWGTFCAPCVEELPDLKRIEEKHNHRLTVVALSNENQEKIEMFLKHRKAPSVVGSILDKDWVNPEEFLPVSIFIKNKKVVSRHMGRLSLDEIENLCCAD